MPRVLACPAAATGQILNQVGLYLQGRAQFPQSKSALERAVDIDEAALGPDYPTMAILLDNLGNILRELGDLEGAREHIQRALEISRDRLGEEHPTTLGIRRNLEALPP